MAFIFVYTKKGEMYYNSGNPDNYPGFTGKNCDLNDAMHIALSRDGKDFIPMRNNTGILFPKADLSCNNSGGITKTLVAPWAFTTNDGNFGICAVRRNQNEEDSEHKGCVMLFTTKDFVRYEEAGFLKLSDTEIQKVHCIFDAEKSSYYMEWATKDGIFCGYTKYFKEIQSVQKCSDFSLKEAADINVTDSIPGNVLEIEDSLADYIEKYLGNIENIGVADLWLKLKAGENFDYNKLPKAICLYNDGSTHEKSVDWNFDDFSKIDFNKPGKYSIKGKIKQKHYPFPFINAEISDPCICEHNGLYYLSCTGMHSVSFRISDTIEGLADAKPIDVYKIPENDTVHENMWAQEMHVIKGVPYVFTTLGEHSWSTVRSHVLKCNGNPGNPDDWDAPRLVLKPDGSELREGGISLDMTYFCVDGVHYVMWSDRCFAERNGENIIPDTADVYIATIDPDAPWQLTTNPVCILRPIYGWDRCQTEVDEGPYLLRRGDDLFVTISGASTGLADLYCVGLLHAKRGNNLLSPKGWDWLPYPILTKESVKGEYGPGHNSFIKDKETGDDLLIYHAVPHDENEKMLGRHMGIRRVHWAANGYPYLEMSEEKDLKSEFRDVVLEVEIG